MPNDVHSLKVSSIKPGHEVLPPNIYRWWSLSSFIHSFLSLRDDERCGVVLYALRRQLAVVPSQ